MTMAQAIVVLGELYLTTGLIVGIAFLLAGLDRIDPAARGAYSFRPLLLPGLVLLWPIVIKRWYALEKAA